MSFGDLIPTLAGAVLVAVAAGFAVVPLLRGKTPLEGSVLAATSSTPEEQRYAIYKQVLDLELDVQTGKLSAEECHRLAAELLSRAATLFPSQPGEAGMPQPGRDLDAEIEREIADARAALAAARPRKASVA